MGLVSTLSETLFEVFFAHKSRTIAAILPPGSLELVSVNTEICRLLTKVFFELLLNHGCKGALLDDLAVVLCRILFLKSETIAPPYCHLSGFKALLGSWSWPELSAVGRRYMLLKHGSSQV